MPIPVNWPTSADAKPTVPERMNQSPTHPEILDFILTLLIKLETELGLDPSSTSATVRARLDSISSTLSSFSGGSGNATFASLAVSGYTRAGTTSASPGWQVRETAGVLNGSGYVALAHNVSDLPRRLLFCQAWYQKAGGEVKFIDHITVDGGHIHLNYNNPVADAANRNVKVGWVYTENPVPW